MQKAKQLVDGLKDKKQTFGANIHTLLSDGFFMEDGLMGEFAKSKIDEIIKFHKKVVEEIEIILYGKSKFIDNEIARLQKLKEIL